MKERNAFHRKRSECFYNRDYGEMVKYVSCRTEAIDEYDKRNRAAVQRNFSKRRPSIELDQQSA